MSAAAVGTRPDGARGRRGFVLAEVIVAAVLVSVGLLAVVATAGFARGRLRVAAAEERVTRAAAMAFDSLRAAPVVADGGVASDGLELEWRVDADGQLDIVVRFGDGDGARSRRYSTRLGRGAP